MALAARSSLAALRSALSLRATAPAVAASIIPYAASSANSLLMGVGNRALQEELLRGCLLAPNERVEDMYAWADDNPTRAWLRRWWLDHAYRGTPRYTAASAQLYDPTLLPNVKSVEKMFFMSDWKRGASGNPNADEARRQAALAKIEASCGDLRGLPTLDILEAAGCAIGSRGLFNAWCEAHGTFEFLTAEFVASLAKHLEGAAGGSGGTVLELGAGSGRLSHFLRRHLAEKGVRVVATDSWSWGLKRKDQLGASAAVEKKSFEKALAAHQPQAVLVSWMPMGVDWSAAIRQTASVQEYVLVGEADDGCCGDNWLTWGNPAFAPAGAGGVESGGAAKAHGGWSRQDLPEVTKLQLSRFDSADFVGNSCTVAFRRPGASGGEGADGGGAGGEEAHKPNKQKPKSKKR